MVIRQKAKFVQSLFRAIGITCLLLIVNRATHQNYHSHHFWGRLPIMIVWGIFLLRIFKFIGIQVAYQVSNKMRHHIHGYLSDRYNEDRLELKEKINFTEKGATWKESDLVKSGLS